MITEKSRKHKKRAVRKKKSEIRKLLEKVPESELCGDITPEELHEIFNDMSKHEEERVRADKQRASWKKLN